MFKFIKNFAFANRLIKFFNNLKKHFENSTVDDKAKEYFENLLNDIKNFGNLTPELKVEAEWLINEIKILFKCEKKK